MGGALAILALPIYIVAVGGLSLKAAAAFAWLVSPLAIAFYVSATGRLAVAHIISAANLTGLVTVVAGLTGGLGSFVLPWFAIVPLEAALSNNRRVIYGSIAIAGAGLLALALGDIWGALPPQAEIGIDPKVLALVGLVSALAYAGGLAVSVHMVHQRSAEAIADGEQRYRLLADNATDLITRHDGDGEVVFASPASTEVVGLTPEALVTSGLHDSIHPNDRAAYRRAVARCLDNRTPESIEFRLLNTSEKTQDEQWLEMRLQPVMDAEDHHHERTIVAVSRDISASKRQAMELRKARDDAESASRAKTHFLATMSHELRTPLNAIIGFADILSRELFGAIGEPRYREYAGLIHESGEHLLSVVNEILDMSKIEAGKYSIEKEPLDVGALVTSCSDLLRHGAEKKSIALTSDVPMSLPQLNADKRACKQMLLNLLSNAIKFTDEGGAVRVKALHVDDQLRLQVIDNGIGIAPEDLPNLGAPFVQAESTYSRSFEGAGLGLCVVTGLAKLHGGSLEMESEPGQGTTVTIVLPMASKPAKLPAEERPAVIGSYSYGSSLA